MTTRPTAKRPLAEAPPTLARATIAAGTIALGSQSALAAWAGASRGQISRMAQGQAVRDEIGWRIATLASAVTALLTVYEPEAISRWFHASNPQLNDRRPLDVLAAGDVASVMAAVQAARTGAFA